MGRSNFESYVFGRAADVDADDTDIWDVSSGSYEFPTQAFETQIVGSVNDIPSSDGVHSVKIEGLDINGAEITEVATLNADTPVTLANSYYRVNRLHVEATGATLVNCGNITVSHTGSATLGRIAPNEGQSQQCIYTLPAGVRARIMGWHCEAARETSQVDVSASIRLQTREAGKGWRTRDSGIAGTAQSIDREFKSNRVTLKPMTDVRMRVTAINTDNVSVTGGFEVQGFRDIR